MLWPRLAGAQWLRTATQNGMLIAVTQQAEIEIGLNNKLILGSSRLHGATQEIAKRERFLFYGWVHVSLFLKQFHLEGFHSVSEGAVAMGRPARFP